MSQKNGSVSSNKRKITIVTTFFLCFSLLFSVYRSPLTRYTLSDVRLWVPFFLKYTTTRLYKSIGLINIKQTALLTHHAREPTNWFSVAHLFIAISSLAMPYFHPPAQDTSLSFFINVSFLFFSFTFTSDPLLFMY